MFARARWRLVGAYTAIIAIILLALGGSVFFLFEQNLYSDVDGPMQYTAKLYAIDYGSNAAVYRRFVLHFNAPRSAGHRGVG